MAVGIGVLISTPSSFSVDFTLPAGWRLPVASKLSNDWRKNDPKKYAVVRGDFSGDGIVDIAMLLVPLRGHSLGLFTFLSQKDKSFKTYQLDASEDASDLEIMGIEKVSSPRKHKTACGKAYWECKGSEGEVPEISIKQMPWIISKLGARIHIFTGMSDQKILEGFG